MPCDHAAPAIEGMYDINEAHSDGITLIYVGACNWEQDFEYCSKEFVLTISMKSCTFSVQT